MSARSHLQSVVKAFSWRAVAAVDSFALGYILTGKLTYAMSFVGVELFTKSGMYYLHERAWHMPTLTRLFGAQTGVGHA